MDGVQRQHTAPSHPVRAQRHSDADRRLSSVGRLDPIDGPSTVGDHVAGTPVERRHDRITASTSAMGSPQAPDLPPVAIWRIHMLRMVYLLMAGVMGFFVWQQVLFETGPWPAPRVIAKSMLASVALLSVLGLRYPLQMLPLMLLETLWKTVAIMLIILPAWLAHRMTPELQVLFGECVGIVLVYLIMPWRYVWIRFFLHPGEAWRSVRTDGTGPGKGFA